MDTPEGILRARSWNSNAGAGHGGNAHVTNEFYVIEGAGKVYGIRRR